MTGQAVAFADLGPDAESKRVTFTGARMAPAAEAMRAGKPEEGARIFLAVVQRQKGVGPDEKAKALSGNALAQLQQRDIAGYLESMRESLSILREHAPDKLWQEAVTASNILIDFADRIGGVEAARGALALLGEFPADDTTALNNALGRAWLSCARQEVEPDTTKKAVAAFKAAIRTAAPAAKLRVQINLAEAQRLLAEQTSDLAPLNAAIKSLEALARSIALSTLPDGPRCREVLGLAQADRSNFFEGDEALAQRKAALVALNDARNEYRTYQKKGDWDGLVRCLNGLGTVYRDGKQFEEAKQVYYEAEGILRSLGYNTPSLSLALIRHNQADNAFSEFEEHHEQWSREKITQTLADSISGFAEAADLRRFVVPLDCARSTAALAGVYLKRGDLTAHGQGDAMPTARADYERAIECYRDAIPDLDQPDRTLRCLGMILALARAAGCYEGQQRLATLFKADIEWLNVRSFEEIPELKGLVANARTQLDNEIAKSINEYRLYLKHMARTIRNDNPAGAKDLAAFRSDLNALLSARVHDEKRRAAIMELVERAITAPLDNANHLALVSGAAASAWADNGQTVTKAGKRKNGSRAAPDPPPGLSWPTETFSGSPESKRGGGGIVSYLERVWKPLLDAMPEGIGLHVLRAVDNSAAVGVNNFTRGGRMLPPHLDFPTKKEVNDRAIQAPFIHREDASRLVRAAQRRASQRRITIS